MSRLPPWIRFLRSSSLTLLKGDGNLRNRIAIAVPAIELSVGAAVFATVRELAVQRSVLPLGIPSGTDALSHVSFFGSGKYEDAVLLDVRDGVPRLRYSGGEVRLEKYGDVVRPLPSSFEPRTSRRALSDEITAAWRTVERFEANAGRIHARVSATPVLVIGSFDGLQADLEVLQGVFPLPKSFCDASSSVDAWFRHPVLVAGPQTEIRSWFPDVSPSLVVAVGAAAWNSKLRRQFWNAPHLLLLDRRSPTSLEIASDLESSVQEMSSLDLERPKGVEAVRFCETSFSSSDFDNEDFEL